MANNVSSEAVVTAGAGWVTAEVTAYGDANKHIPGCFMAIVTGSEGSQTFAEIVGGAGAVSAGVQRVTLASDDPAVVAVQIMDDWDESDRAKVNLIVGQAGIAAGAGAVGVTVPRVTLASDDPAVTSLQLLDNAISGNEMQVDVVAALPAGTNNIGDVDVLSVIPGTGATNLGKAIDTATGATDTGVLALATRDDALSALTPIEGDNVQLRTDANGALWVIPSGTVTVAGTGTFAVQAVCTNAGTFAVQAVCTNAGTFAVQAAQSGTWTVDLGATDNAVLDAIAASLAGTLTVGSHAVTNAGTFAVQAACTNAGTFAVQVDGAALTALQLIDNPVLVDDAAFTPATSSVMMAGFQADETATDSVDEGDAGAARMTLDRKILVNPQPHTAGGLSIFRSIDLDETEEDVKTSAGQVYACWVTNTHTATLYLKFYNATAANVVVGTTAPVITIPIPGNSSDDISAVLAAGGYGIAFDTAICVAVTTGLADADTGAPAANAFICNIFYR